MFLFFILWFRSKFFVFSASHVDILTYKSDETSFQNKNDRVHWRRQQWSEQVCYNNNELLKKSSFSDLLFDLCPLTHIMYKIILLLLVKTPITRSMFCGSLVRVKWDSLRYFSFDFKTTYLCLVIIRRSQLY